MQNCQRMKHDTCHLDFWCNHEVLKMGACIYHGAMQMMV